MRLKKYEGNPVLSPNPGRKWENLAVCNPGVWYEGGIFYMLYRAAGDDEEHIIRFGLATSGDGFNFNRASDSPVFSPSFDGEDSGCVEDPRIVKFGEYYYVTYAFRPYPPGQYWKFAHNEVNTKYFGEDAPDFLNRNLANTALTITKDFKNWKRLGRITSAAMDDRDVIIFPEKINGRYAMLHRPKEWIGENYGTMYPSIWIKYSDDLLAWSEPSELLFEGRQGSWEEKIGGSAPPLRTDKGWLMLYHGVADGGRGYYRVGAAVLDLNNPSVVLGRAKDFILEPEFVYEKDGFYRGCVFPTGNVIVGDTLYVYYGCADKYVGVATANVGELVDYILSQK